MTTATIPTAMQLYKPLLKEKIARQGWCPEHGNRSSLWLGVQPSLFGKQTMWLFTCKTKAHPPHLFLNHVDPYAPKSGHEDEWVKAQVAALTQAAVQGKKKAGQ